MPFHFGLALLKVVGALAASVESYTFARITACGHTITHLPHWMQRSSSHTGISCAIFRFSHCEVPVGKVPPGGNALTGSRSPRPAAISPRTLYTNAGAPSGSIGKMSNVAHAFSGK